MNNPAFNEVKQTAAPYPGLRPFRDDETEIFFGREAQTDQLLEKLQPSHFLAVVGPSGCGKSSLVRAGLIAGLEAGFLADAGAGWRVAEMRPGDLPFVRLAAALLAPSALGLERGMDATEAAIVQAMLRRGPLGLIEILRETRLPASENLLLLVDQFEEIFRFREQASADDADAFVALLLASFAQREVPVYVVITMRSDFLGDCALFTGLPEAINDSQSLTPRLSRDQIRAAITGPARVFGGDVEPALVNRLLNEIGPDPDQLPLLQHALMRMWALVKDRNDHGESLGLPGGAPPSAVVTMADYEAVGALSEALSSHADQVLSRLSERQQYIVRVMLARLTERGVGKRDTRRPARLGDVAAVADVEVQEVIDVVEQLRQQDRSFLTPPPPFPISAETVLDIGHESLIRQWHKLYDWVEEEATSAAMYRRLLQTAHLWDAGRAALWSSPDLDEALKWRQTREPSKPWSLRYGTGEEFELAMNFLRASEDHAARLRQALDAEEARRAQEERERALQQQAKKFRLTLGVSAVLALCVIGASALAWWAWNLRNEAEALRRISRSREIALQAAQPLQTDPELGLLLAIEAYREASTPQAEGVLQRAALASKLRGQIFQGVPDGPVDAPQLTPDGNVAVARTLSPSGSKVYIQNIKAGGEPIVIDAHGPRTLIVPSPDRKYVVIPDSEASVRVWETATGRPVAGPLNLDGKLTRAFFAPHGGVFGVMTNAGKLGFWETQTWQPLPAIEEPMAARPLPALSYDSKYLVAASQDQRLRVWETATGQEVSLLGDETIDAATVRFSPDGQYIVTTNPKRVVSLWETATGQEVSLLGDETIDAATVQFSPDGKYIVTAHPKRVASLWSTESKERIRDIGDERRPVDSIRFSPDGSQVLTTAEGGTPPNDNLPRVARVWSVDKPEEVKDLDHPVKDPMRRDNDTIETADFSPDGKLILTIASGVLRTWRSPFDTGAIELKGHAGDVRTARFSQDSRWIVSTGIDGAAKLWDAITGQIVANFSGVSFSISRVWLSEDAGRLLTASRDDGTIRVWNTINLGLATALVGLSARENRPLLEPAYDSSFLTQNGKYLLVATKEEGIARVWDTSTGQLKHTFGDSQNKVKRVFPSADGKLAIMMRSDQTAWVVEIDTGQRLNLLEPKEELTASVFSDQGRMAWTWDTNGVIKLWRLSDNALVAAVQTRDKGIRTRCVEISPDALWLVTCGQEETKPEKGITQVRRLSSGEKFGELTGHTAGIKDVFFSDDGRFAVSASYDKTAKIWEVGKWRDIATLQGHDVAVNYALFSPDTSYLVTVADNKLRVWDAKTWRVISELRGHTGSVKAVAWSPNGRWLVTGSDDNTARVWDPTTGVAVVELYGHSGPVIAVAFDDNSKEIVTASEDGTIRRYSCEACVPSSELRAIAQQRLKAIGRPSLSPSEQETYLR